MTWIVRRNEKKISFLNNKQTENTNDFVTEQTNFPKYFFFKNNVFFTERPTFSITLSKNDVFLLLKDFFEKTIIFLPNKRIY